jgi:hypothetical protein
MPRRKRTDRRWQARVSARREKRRGERMAQAPASSRPGRNCTAGSELETGVLAPAPDGLDTSHNNEGASSVEVTQHGEPPTQEGAWPRHDV